MIDLGVVEDEKFLIVSEIRKVRDRNDNTGGLGQPLKLKHIFSAKSTHC